MVLQTFVSKDKSSIVFLKTTRPIELTVQVPEDGEELEFFSFLFFVYIYIFHIEINIVGKLGRPET